MTKTRHFSAACSAGPTLNRAYLEPCRRAGGPIVQAFRGLPYLGLRGMRDYSTWTAVLPQSYCARSEAAAGWPGDAQGAVAASEEGGTAGRSSAVRESFAPIRAGDRGAPAAARASSDSMPPGVAGSPLAVPAAG